MQALFRTLLFALFVFAIVLVCATARGDTPLAAGEQIGLTGEAFGTSYSVIVAAPVTTVVPDELQRRIDDLLAEIDAQMSLWKQDSELSRFNRHRGMGWFDISSPTARVVVSAAELSRETEGAFDPTVSPLVELWGFGQRQHALRIPTNDEISQARKQVGISLIDVRLSPPAIRKHQPDVQLDLNAIAKGDAVDRVAALLDMFAPLGYLVEIGGEVRTRGSKADGSPWGIGIEQPAIGRRLVQSVVELHDAALATSGDYRNFIELDGQRFSHTIDPRTGRPIAHSLAAVSVVADNCMTADAWATALMVLGAKQGHRLAEERGIKALFLTRTEDGHVSRTTTGFPRVRQPAETAAQAGWGETPIGTLILAAIVFGLAIAGMSVGVIFSNRRLRGSCGGLNGLKDDRGNPLCDACTQPASECDEFREKMLAASAKPRNPDAATPGQ